MIFTTIIEIHKHLHRSRHLQKLLFHGPAHLRAAVPSGPLSYCFGIMATSGEPSTWLPLGELEGREPPPLFILSIFSDILRNFRKITPFFNFFEKSGTDRTLKF